MQDESCVSVSHSMVGMATVRLFGSFHDDAVSHITNIHLSYRELFQIKTYLVLVRSDFVN